MSRYLVVLLLAGACGDGGGNIPDPDCNVSITFTPSMPIAGPNTEVRAASLVSTQLVGVRDYNWRVRHDGANVPFDDARPDGSEISFITETTGIYEVTLDVSMPGTVCPSATRSITARMNGDTSLFRLHITPPLGADAPPDDRLIDVPDGADLDLGPVVLEPGRVLSGMVSGPSGGVSAYLKFIPDGAPEAIVEAFADGTGAFTARVTNRPHKVLVVPSGNLAPALLPWTPTSSGTFSVSSGSTVAGLVQAPNGSLLAGAKVQLTVDGVPSTLGTTLANGTYTVQVADPTGDITVEVTPPAGSGLPRLEATSATFNLSAALDIRYAPSLVVRDLAGLQVRRSGSPLANAKVAVVGALAASGTVAAANATGIVRIAATANGSGNLPATLVAAGPLSAVVRTTGTDVSVAALDLTSSVPATLNVPTMLSINTALTDGTDGLEGAGLELVPRGPLALAGASSIYFTAGTNGTITGQVAAGGTYDAFLTDPAGRAGARAITNVTGSNLALSYELPPPVYVKGVVSVTGNPNRVHGASIQILCTLCTGVDRDRPLAEVATDPAGGFTIAVPDPAAL